MNKQQLKESGLFCSIIEAAKRGIPEFIIELIKANPELDSSGEDFFFAAVRHRQSKVFSLIYGFIWEAQITTVREKESRNNLLHMAGMLAPSEQLNRISGAALKMQRELQWFKVIIFHLKLILKWCFCYLVLILFLLLTR